MHEVGPPPLPPPSSGPVYGQVPRAPEPPPKAPNPRRPFYWIMGILGVGCLLPTVLICFGTFAFLAYVGTVGPGTEAVEGNRIGPHTRKEIVDLKILPAGDTIQWFYSDGFMSAKEGMYFFTDKELVFYSENWTPPEYRIPLGNITDLTFNKSPGWPDDSTVFVEELGDEVWTFPISMEAGKDEAFFEALESAVNKARSAAGADSY